MDISDYLRAKRNLIDPALDRYLPQATEEPRSIHECMRYSLLHGKRLRPILTLAVAEMLGCPAERVLPTCSAIEFIHTHSLILDDLPCMDDDDYRRGRPTCHKLFGESVALLAADALLNLAITLLGANPRLTGLRSEIALEIIREVGEAAGTRGVIGGQLADLTFASQGAGTDALKRIHLGKTAQLFRLSARAGALVAEARPPQLVALSSYAEHLGLAFQVVDDVLDRLDGSPQAPKRGKMEPSYAAIYGREAARALAARTTEEALADLAIFGDEAKTLRLLANYNLARDS